MTPPTEVCEAQDREVFVTVSLRLDDARALSVFARLGLVRVLRDRRIGSTTHVGLGRGLHALNGAIEQACADPKPGRPRTPKLTRGQADEIRALASDMAGSTRGKARVIGPRYGVSAEAVRQVLMGRDA